MKFTLSLVLALVLLMAVGCGGEGLTEEEAEATANAAVAAALARVDAGDPCPTAAACPEVELCPECEECAACPTAEACPECPEAPAVEGPAPAEAPAGDASYVLSVVGMEDPTEPDLSFFSLQEGKRLVAIELVFSNVSGAPVSLNPSYDAYLIDTEGFNYPAEGGALLAYDQMWMFELSAGEKGQGWLGFAIPEGAVPEKIKYEVAYGEFIEAEIP